ncbi:cation-transporting P-type ATPase [Marinobacterium nitratireducens]|uniref:Cation-transporting P-type ATPase n=2 Tax=Marinobacterium nitratireducens TaxID=518897 RepID=A0A917Z5N1_9GAMM|nr:heavy metal translocating P-type ATPase [Marinobacterium nitratireducens]GGO75784.1 cation-transporting P-type ATPase [Marinobacterium nitratireducens]
MTNAATAEQVCSCFHCGRDVPPGSDFVAQIDGQSRPMCCPGCQAVAQTIVESGLDNYYRHRSSNASAPEIPGRQLPEAMLAELALYDQPSIQKDFVHALDDSRREASLVIEGITCAACAWLLDHHLGRQPGVEQASVNLSSHRMRLCWDNDRTSLSQLLAAIYRIGYQGHPYHPDREEQLLEQEKKRAIRRLGVAGVGMMQVMMYAIALYAGAMQDMEERFVVFLRWASLIIATPVALYAARPFYVAAIRDLRSRNLSMDVPVSIAILGAYCASVWATLTDSGEVYFDSVTMFTFFLLIGRYLEMQARHRTGRAGNALLNLLPTSALRLTDGGEQLVAATELVVGDRVLVKPGHTIPADGIIRRGHSSIDESALTGEYLPVRHREGETVVGGTLNVENPIEIEISRTGGDTQLSAIVRLLDRAQAEKPGTARIADRVSSYFVAAVLATAAGVSLIWWQIEPSDAFWVTLSVLVVTCPCALSLATPTALTAATGTLRQNGLLITRGHVLESLAKATHVVFDKTGTLTEGNLSLRDVITLEGSRDDALRLAAALEAHSEHPIARAFRGFGAPPATDLESHLGQGLEGLIDGRRYRIGKPEFAIELAAGEALPAMPDQHGHWLLLCAEDGPLAWFGLDDQLRQDAVDSVRALKSLGIEVEMLTGDSSPAAHEVASRLGIERIQAGVTPEQKLAHIRRLQQEGAQLVMVGDGINDIPVLAGAQTSVAMGSATDLAKTCADAVLLTGSLGRLVDAVLLARKCRAIIRENLGWALLYNLLALPLAATGFIAPYMAAIGMSASSLVVVGNALRLSKLVRRKPSTQAREHA